jgi:hypothetical protein
VAVIAGGRYARGIQKLLGIKGEVVIPDLDSALQAGMDLGSLEDHIDTRLFFGWRSYGVQQLQAAVAAQNSQIYVINPANSGMLIAIDRIDAFSPAVDQGGLLISVAGAQAEAGSRGVPRDSRGGGLFSSAGLVRGAASAGIPGTPVITVFPDLFGAASTIYKRIVTDNDDSWVLKPGDQTFLALNTVNTQLNASVWWRERALDPDELRA